jgi:DNA repair exonuclease SbcCD ATPase subunit
MWRFLPIHSASAKNPPENIMNALIRSYRKGAQCRDDQGMLPLHYACGNQASIEVIRLLLLAYPEGAFTTDPQGMLPLHFLAQFGPTSTQALDVILFANRDAIDMRNAEGYTPMDLARNEGNAEVVEVLEQFLAEQADSKTNQIGYKKQGISTPRSNQQRGILTTPRSNQRSMVSSLGNTNSPSRRVQDTNHMSSLSSSSPSLLATNAVLEPKTPRQEYLTPRRRQTATEHVLEDRDDDNSVMGALPRVTKSFSSHRDTNLGVPTVVGRINSLDESNYLFNQNNDEAKKMVEELKAEVERLRSEAADAEREAEKTISDERMKMQAALDEMRQHLIKCEEESRESMSQLEEREEQSKSVESRLEEKENELGNAVKRNEQLRKEVDAIKKEIANYKAKASKLDSNLTILSKTMTGLISEQEHIMKASIKHEQHMKKVALARQQKMQELIDQEVKFARMSLEKQKDNELGSEELINEALEKQKQLMSAVQNVLNERRSV